jgi:large subunit ribosomal protein L7/L12
MAKMTKDELVNAIAELTVLELSELVKAIEEKFGVKAAAPAVAVAAAAAPAAAAAEEKDEFNVVLTGVTDASKKISVIKVVREITGLGLKEAKDLVEGAPKAVKENVAKAEAEELKKKITEAGGAVELK